MKKSVEKKEFYLPSKTEPLGKYDSISDPYCPYTRTPQFQSHMAHQESLEQASRKRVLMSQTQPISHVSHDFNSSMMPMERPVIPEREKFPKHTVSNTNLGAAGLTYSSESKNNLLDGKAELEVLKAILNREAYLNRLQKLVQRINKKFNPEVSDVLDFVRASSLDVIEAIVKWREVKNDHDASFMWNGLNYLLKMSSDLDYLDKYLAIRNWMGFSLVRNPFCVPYAMEGGVNMFADRLLDPQHLDPGLSNDGFIVGGITQKRLRSKYTPSLVKAKETHSGTGTSVSSAKSGLTSPYAAGNPKLDTGARLIGDSIVITAPQTFVLNSDMSKIKQAELVLLKEEDKFGKHSRDPEGRVVPHVQAVTRQTALELRKDDLRPLEEPSKSGRDFAPHAANSDIGIAAETWTPEAPLENKLLKSHLLEVTDNSVSANKRGITKLGGHLAPLTQRGALGTREHKPIKPSLASGLEFHRNRQNKKLGDKLQEISHMREQIIAAKLALERELLLGPDGKSVVNSTPLSPMGRVKPLHVTMERSNSADGGQYNKGSPGQHRPGSEGTPVVDNALARKQQPNRKNSQSARTSSNKQEAKNPEMEGREDSIDISQSSDPGNIGVEANSELYDRLKILDQEEYKATNEIEHNLKESERIWNLKEEERIANNKERSRDIERKRRLLTLEGGKRQGPPKTDEPNVYDYYSTRIQKIIRGWLCRCWVQWYRIASTKAVIVLQAGIRGWLGRMRVRRMRRVFRAATNIQRMFKGFKARTALANVSAGKKLDKTAIKIQKMVRGRLGRNRHRSKRLLDIAAARALESVDPRALGPQDCKDLGKRIIIALEEPLSNTCGLPPDEVLQLLRITTTIIQGVRGSVGLADYSFINERFYKEVDGCAIGWVEIAKVVNRSERMLRMLRSLAFGPAARPPRLLQVPTDARMLFKAQANNPRWILNTFETMGPGAKFCAQLFIWLTSIMELSERQNEFLYFITSNFPDWLPALYETQEKIRCCEFDVAMNDKYLAILEGEHIKAVKDDYILAQLIDEERIKISTKISKLLEKKDGLRAEEANMRSVQVGRESFALSTMTSKYDVMKSEYDENVQQFAEINAKALLGDRVAIELLPQCRLSVTLKKMAVLELESQVQLLKLEIANNDEKRQSTSHLPAVVTYLASMAGESKGLHLIGMFKTKILVDAESQKMLPNRTSKDGDYSKSKYEETFKSLKHHEDILADQANIAFMAADKARREVYATIKRQMTEAMARDIKNKSVMTPTELEMQEERLEDEAQARSERLMRTSWIPSSIMETDENGCKQRPRPSIIALSRDISSYAKTKIHNEINRLMPGIFITLDIEKNMGFDVVQMQNILDANKSIIMSVDHGLTRLTRGSFTQSFEMFIKSLVPNPFVALAIGDDTNRRCNSGSSHHGVHKKDLAVMRDGDIKGALESIYMILDELSHRDSLRAMQALSSEIIPPTQALVLVLEAVFVIQSDDYSKIVSPDRLVAPTSWRLAQRILADPMLIVSKLKLIKRGKATLAMCEVLERYLAHPLWPLSNSIQRYEIPVLNMLAYYVEQWTHCENMTLERGGPPSEALSKSKSRIFHTVVIVTDSVDADDLIARERLTAGWRMSAAKLAKAALQDLRVVKTALRIGGYLYNVAVYRENTTVYFDVYDPMTSESYMTTVHIKDVPNLLIPNAFNADLNTKDGKKIHLEPPQSPHDMYMRLAKLLKFEQASKRKDAKKVLYCSRDYSFLERRTLKIDGHVAMITCFEASLGELYFTAYIPEISAQLKVLMDSDTRLALFHNGDPLLESPVFQNEDARSLLSHVVDRLRISPGHTASAVQAEFRKYGRFRDRFSSIAFVKAQGLSLKIRCKGGAGRTLVTQIHHFSNVPHILTVRSSTQTKELRIIAYEPRTRHTMEVRVSALKRRVIFKVDNDDIRSWFKPLVRRLHICWRGSHTLHFDCSIAKRIRKVYGRRLLFTLGVVDESSIDLTIMDVVISRVFTCTLSKEAVIRLSHIHSEQAVKRETGFSIKNLSIRNILDSVSGKGGKKETKIDPAVFNRPIESFLDHENLSSILDQICTNLQRINEDNFLEGYKTNIPTDIYCYPVGQGKKHLVDIVKDAKAAVDRQLAIDSEKPVDNNALETKLRHEDRLQRSPRTHTVEGIIRYRAQMPIIDMEVELNILAMQKSQEAMAIIEANLRATEEMELHFQALATRHTSRVGTADEALNRVISAASIATTESLVTNVEKKAAAGKQKLLEDQGEEGIGAITENNRIVMMSGDGKSVVEVDMDLLTEEEIGILGKGEKIVYEGGLKTHYRQGSARWHGHIAVIVLETICFMPDDFGVGRRLRFVVFEPISSQYYQGIVRSSRHLSEVLGLRGQDLMDKQKTKEMILHIVKHRMDVVKLDQRDTQNLPEGEELPAYRIDFVTDRLYTKDKITPINAALSDDTEANKSKLFDQERMRGEKLLRMVRRVSGLIMQLTAFELPQTKTTSSAKNEQVALASASISNEKTTTIAKSSKRAARREKNNGPLAHLDGVDDNDNLAEVREKSKMQRYDIPTIRIIGYDPKTKRKSVCVAPPDAVLEVAGGIYSPYLDPSRRRELAKVICDSLVLFFPRGKPFELVVPWSQSVDQLSTAVVTVKPGQSLKLTQRSSAERVIKRPGRIFRGMMHLCKFDVLVTLYSNYVQAARQNLYAIEEIGEPESQIIVNVYSQSSSEAEEIVVTETEQIERMGRPITDFVEGAVRAAAIRRFCRFLRVDLIEDPTDPRKRILELQLVRPGAEFIPEYERITPYQNDPEVYRPVGVPEVFMPLDTCGLSLHRRGMKLDNRDSKIVAKDYIVTVYTKSEREDPERGLVIKCYERGTMGTMVLHIGSQELVRLCDEANEPDLINDMIKAKLNADNIHLDSVESEFEALTKKGDLVAAYKKLVDQMVDIILADIGVRDVPDQSTVLYLRSSPYGIPPN